MHSNLVDHLCLTRRELLVGSLALAGGLFGSALPGTARAATAGRAGGLDYQDTRDNLYAFGKIWSSFAGPVIGAYHGLMYVRVPGKRAVPVFGFAGTGIMQCRQDENGDLWMKSRETAYFTDLKSGDVLETWDNPFTGRTVEVYHFYNDILGGKIGQEIPKFLMGANDESPTQMNEGTAFPDAEGKYPFLLPFQRFGEDMMLSWDYTHEYVNPVTPEGWPRSSTGPKVAPSEHFTMRVDRKELEDRDVPSCRMISGFARISECWPFMEMGGTPFAGATLFGRMFSHKGLPGYGDVPRKILDYMERHAPDFLTLPDGWPVERGRIDTWKAYVQDVPPENPDYPWQAGTFKVPTGKGARREAPAAPVRPE